MSTSSGSTRRRFGAAAAAGIALAAPAGAGAQAAPTTTTAAHPRGGGDGAGPAPQTGYAPVNGLRMYYELHGEGTGQPPLVVLHGALMTVGAMGPLVPALAAHRRVVAVELQGHGHTADIDRPLRYEQLADDTAALLRQLKIEGADVFGYSLGGGVALQLAVRHPALVRQLVAAAATWPVPADAYHPGVLAGIAAQTPDAFAGSPWHEAYAETAPRPGDWPRLIEKVQELTLRPQAWPPEALRALDAPALVVTGDADNVRPEHAVELLRLLGGGVAGDFAGLPRARLAVLPGTTHVTLLHRAEWLLPMVTEFLAAPPA